MVSIIVEDWRQPRRGSRTRELAVIRGRQRLHGAERPVEVCDRRESYGGGTARGAGDIDIARRVVTVVRGCGASALKGGRHRGRRRGVFRASTRPRLTCSSLGVVVPLLRLLLLVAQVHLRLRVFGKPVCGGGGGDGHGP